MTITRPFLIIRHKLGIGCISDQEADQTASPMPHRDSKRKPLETVGVSRTELPTSCSQDLLEQRTR